MAGINAMELLAAAGLDPRGPVPWDTRIPFSGPGVYVVETPGVEATAPLDETRVAAWIARVPSIRVDGVPPSTAALARRLAAFWIPGESIVYIGLAGTNVSHRVAQYYRTPLGDPRPHAGGHWIKTLSGLDSFRVWWAATSDPSGAEAVLLTEFARHFGDPRSLPFANRQGVAGYRKPHGITGSTVAAAPKLRSPRTPEARVSTTRPVATDIERINTALQQMACATPEREVTAVHAARELDRLGMLRDSESRPGLPLRNLLRAGEIRSAHQVNGRWWFISCSSDQ